MKSALESKTIIVNLVLALIAFLDMTTGGNLAQWLVDVTGAENIELAILAICNIILRFKTNTGIGGLISVD